MAVVCCILACLGGLSVTYAIAAIFGAIMRLPCGVCACLATPFLSYFRPSKFCFPFPLQKGALSPFLPFPPNKTHKTANNPASPLSHPFYIINLPQLHFFCISISNFPNYFQHRTVLRCSTTLSVYGQPSQYHSKQAPLSTLH